MAYSETVALLGATGQLGQDIIKAARQQGVKLFPLGHDSVEVTNVENVQQTLTKVHPTIVINCSAFHQVDRCEEDPVQALQVNALGALNVARSANNLGARCMYISTDYVFSGDKPPPKDGHTTNANSYAEHDAPNPVNVYGASKLAGEKLTSIAQPNTLIVRVASLFGVAGARGKGGNFIETILKKAKEGGPLKVVNDQYMTPTYTMDAANAILRLARMDLPQVVHVTNSGACTWYDLACKALELVGLSARVEPVPASSYASKAKRPINSALNTEYAAGLLGSRLRPWEDALRAYLEEKAYINNG